MKKLLTVLLLIIALNAQSAIVTNLVVQMKNSVSVKMANRYVYLEPTDENEEAGYFVPPETIKQKADANGSTTFTNVVNGYYYLRCATTPPSTWYLAITNGAADSVNATNYLTSSQSANGLAQSYTKSQADGRFVRGVAAGSGTTTSTNNGIVTVSASSGSGESNTVSSADGSIGATKTGVDIDLSLTKIPPGVTNDGGEKPLFGPTQHDGSALTNFSLGFVNVKDFGAVGDGVTDDTAAINSALLKCQNEVAWADLSSTVGLRTNGILYFPAGTYRRTGPIYITNNFVRIEGAGRDRTKLKFDSGSGIIVTNSARNLWFEGFTLIGDSSTGVGMDINGHDDPGDGGPGIFPLYADFDIKSFDIGLKATGMHSSRLRNNIYNCRIGWVLTNVINHCKFDGVASVIADVGAVIGQSVENSSFNVDNWALATSFPATNLIRFVGSCSYLTISGRSEQHANGTGIFFEPSVYLINFEQLDFVDFGGNGWAVEFANPWTGVAELNFNNSLLYPDNPTYGGARIKVTHPYDQRLTFENMSQVPIAVFDSGVYRTNYYSSEYQTFYDVAPRMSVPNSASWLPLGHKLWNYRPVSSASRERLYYPFYDVGLVMTNANLLQYFADKNDGKVLEYPITTKVRLNGTNLSSSAVTGPALSVVGDNLSYSGWDIVAGSSSQSTGSKTMRMGAVNYNAALNPLTAIYAYHPSSTAAQLNYGGGTGAGSPFREHLWYQGDSTANGAGTATMKLSVGGGLTIGSTANPATGDAGDGNLAMHGSTAAGTHIIVGAGTPLADSPVGSIAMRTDGSAGTTAYFKESSGSGGWVPRNSFNGVTNTGPSKLSGAITLPPVAMGSTNVDITVSSQTYDLTADTILKLSGEPASAGTVIAVTPRNNDTAAHTVTFLESDNGTNFWLYGYGWDNSYSVPAGEFLSIALEWDGAKWKVGGPLLTANDLPANTSPARTDKVYVFNETTGEDNAVTVATLSEHTNVFFHHVTRAFSTAGNTDDITLANLNTLTGDSSLSYMFAEELAAATTYKDRAVPVSSSVLGAGRTNIAARLVCLATNANSTSTLFELRANLLDSNLSGLSAPTYVGTSTYTANWTPGTDGETNVVYSPWVYVRPTTTNEWFGSLIFGTGSTSSESALWMIGVEVKSEPNAQ